MVPDGFNNRRLGHSSGMIRDQQRYAAGLEERFHGHDVAVITRGRSFVC